MSERTKLLKKAVLTGVGASTSADRIKSALNDAMQDLVKVGQDLLNDLEVKGKDKAESAQSFLKNLQDEAGRRTKDLQTQVSTRAQTSLKKAAKEMGFVTREEYDELIDRLSQIEDLIAGGPSDEEGIKRSSRKRSSNSD